jgi:hypothetical protein
MPRAFAFRRSAISRMRSSIALLAPVVPLGAELIDVAENGPLGFTIAVEPLVVRTSCRRSMGGAAGAAASSAA